MSAARDDVRTINSDLLSAMEKAAEERTEMLEALTRAALALGQCLTDPLNPCWDDRPSDVVGKHWGKGDACAYCYARAVVSKATH